MHVRLAWGWKVDGVMFVMFAAAPEHVPAARLQDSLYCLACVEVGIDNEVHKSTWKSIVHEQCGVVHLYSLRTKMGPCPGSVVAVCHLTNTTFL